MLLYVFVYGIAVRGCKGNEKLTGTKTKQLANWSFLQKRVLPRLI
jgi:hypothetical protein